MTPPNLGGVFFWLLHFQSSDFRLGESIPNPPACPIGRFLNLCHWRLLPVIVKCTNSGSSETGNDCVERLLAMSSVGKARLGTKVAHMHDRGDTDITFPTRMGSHGYDYDLSLPDMVGGCSSRARDGQCVICPCWCRFVSPGDFPNSLLWLFGNGCHCNDRVLWCWARMLVGFCVDICFNGVGGYCGHAAFA